MSDCLATIECYHAISDEIIEKYGIDAELKKVLYLSHEGEKAKNIAGDASEANPDSPFYQKVCVVTGKLEHFSRQEVMQLIADIGGINADGVNKKTDYLIVGNFDYCTNIKNGKSNKQKKAEALKLDGYDIEVIPESVFYEMIAIEE